MHKPKQSHREIEDALQRLMPVALSEGTQSEMECMLDDLNDDAESGTLRFPKYLRWSAAAGIAAAAAFGVFISFHQGDIQKIVSSELVETDFPELEFLAETDRVERVRDEGLYVDTGGSAVRKMSVRLVEERQIKDLETGIVVMLTEPREEMYMVPVSTF